MAKEPAHRSFHTFSLASANGQVRADIVPELGGIVSSLILPGPDGLPRECLYQHDWFWESGTEHTRGGLPLLFPICGRLLKNETPGLYHVDGAPFHLPIHGFAMRLPWEVRDFRSPDVLRLRLVDSAATHVIYPFTFELDLCFRVSATGLSCELGVRNTGTAPMPYTAGFHPYFATPPPGKGKEQTRFETAARARLRYNETKTDVLGSAPPPAFPRAIAGDDINGLLLDVAGHGDSRLRFPDGFQIIQTASELFRYRQFYTLPDEPFFCDEPWMAPPGSLNRPGAARLLAPGQSDSATLHIAAASA